MITTTNGLSGVRQTSFYLRFWSSATLVTWVSSADFSRPDPGDDYNTICEVVHLPQGNDEQRHEWETFIFQTK